MWVLCKAFRYIRLQKSVVRGEKKTVGRAHVGWKLEVADILYRKTQVLQLNINVLLKKDWGRGAFLQLVEALHHKIGGSAS
jgi:hypothetical protein